MKELDMRGIQCPVPVMEAKKAMGGPDGDVVAVRVDNEVAVQNLTRLAKNQGRTAEVKKLGEEDFVVEMAADAENGVRTAPGEGMPGKEMDGGADAQGETVKAQETGAPARIRKGMVAVISSDQMGEPDAVLGRILMKGFIYALAGQDALPETMLFYNGGARLTTEGSENLEDLIQMEAEGVQILTCGTCLKHLGLEEKLKVGLVSNMYDIVEKMTSAGMILRP